MAVDTDTEIVYRRPKARDGTRVWELIRDTGSLDLNSPIATCRLEITSMIPA